MQHGLPADEMPLVTEDMAGHAGTGCDVTVPGAMPSNALMRSLIFQCHTPGWAGPVVVCVFCEWDHDVAENREYVSMERPVPGR